MTTQRWRRAGLSVLLASVLMLLWAIPAAAQSSSIVTDDEVLEIAEKMFCPICENEPLDECRNLTCMQWKDEIKRQLQAGQTEEEIITYFVDRYGQKVVSVPTDPLLRGISFAAPIIGAVVALLIGVWTFRQWMSNDPAKEIVRAQAEDMPLDDEYRKRLEQDLL